MKYFFKRFFDLINSKKEFIFILSICVLPVLSILRLFLKPVLGNFSSIFSLILSILILCLNLFLFYRILVNQAFSQQMVSWFIYLLNRKIVQRFIFFCLLLEQILKLNFLLNIILIFSFCIFLSDLFTEYPDSIYVLQFFLIILGIYYRFRKKILGEEALLVLGIDLKDGVLTWKDVIHIMNLQMNQLQKKSMTSTHLADQDSISQIIENKCARRNHFVFPFFLYNRRQQLNTSAAFKTVFAAIKSGYQVARTEINLAATGGIGLISWGSYTLYRDYQNDLKSDRDYEQKKLESDREYERKKLEFQQQMLESDREYERKKLEFQQQMKMQEQDIALEKEKIELRRQELDFLKQHKNAENCGITKQEMEKLLMFDKNKKLLDNKISAIFEKKNATFIEKEGTMGLFTPVPNNKTSWYQNILDLLDFV